MPKHCKTIELPYSAQQIFDVVADVESYPLFLPWCLDLRITKREQDAILADLTVGYKFIRDSFSSRVCLNPAKSIEIEYLNGPMKNLENRWSFKDIDGGCEVDFFIDFEFKSAVFEKIAGAFLEKGILRMTDAFKDRAKQLYG